MRIVFFGTPQFAVPSLRALLGERYPVVGVVTQPDRPQGRSRSTLVASPVKLEAEAAGIPVLQPARPLGDVFLASLRRLEADLGVVVAYGHILRPAVLALPRLGMINVHASLLPHLRGAAPIHWSILNGDAITGVSIMRMEAGLDSGPVLHRVETAVRPEETTGDLSARLAALGAEALVEALTLVEKGAEKAVPQDESRATYAPKITRQSARVDWAQEAMAVSRRVRAFDPAPGAWTTLDGTELKLFGARPTRGSAEPGTVLEAGRTLVVAAGDGAVEVAEVQPAGKRRLSVEEWARGRGAGAGMHFA
jgi:methionyl-tRNA formyltransferase